MPRTKTVLWLDSAGHGHEQTRQQKDDRGGEQAIFAEGVEDSRLQINQPKRGAEHDSDHRGQQVGNVAITKGRERCATEDGEVSETAQAGQRHAVKAGVRALQNLGAGGGGEANYIRAGQMERSQVGCLEYSGDGENGDKRIKDGAHAIGRCRRLVVFGWNLSALHFNSNAGVGVGVAIGVAVVNGLPLSAASITVRSPGRVKDVGGMDLPFTKTVGVLLTPMDSARF